MPHCIALDCQSHSGRKQGENISFHSFPKNVSDARVWYARCGTDLQVSVDKFNPAILQKTFYLCSRHFESSDFTTEMQEKMGFKVKRELKDGVLPTFFSRQSTSSCSSIGSNRISSINRARKRENEELISRLLKGDVVATETILASQVSTSDAHHDTDVHFNMPTDDTDVDEDDDEDRIIGDAAQNTIYEMMSEDSTLLTPQTVEQGVQTDWSWMMKDAWAQWPEFELNSTADQNKVDHDHRYAKVAPFESPIKFSPCMIASSSTPQKLGNDVDMDIIDWDESLPIDETSQSDPDYEVGDVSFLSEDSFMESAVSKETWEEKKFIIFETQLNFLLQMVSCPECSAKVDPEDISTTQTGSFLSVRFVCLNSHQFEWKSQPMFGRQPAGNVLVAAATLFTGSTYEHVSSFAQCLNMQVLGRTCFFDLQHEHLFPVISSVWNVEREKQLKQLQEADQCSIVLIGDGRLDSPGWNAKYMVYTLMHKETSEIVDFELVQVSETGTSQSMEKEGCRRGLDYLADNDIHVEVLGTDRHTGIQAMMKQLPYSSIVKFHEFDPWHIIKGVEAKIRNKAKKKDFRALGLWVRSISNHLWWCMSSSQGNPQLVKEKWLSILYHVANIHEWDSPDMPLFKKCDHGPLDDQQGVKPWMKVGSTPHEGLKSIVRDKHLLPALHKTSRLCNTGKLEVYHSMLLKYTPKREHFSYEGMLARTMLAALDNNANVNRKQAVVSHPTNYSAVKGELRYDGIHRKSRKEWVARPIYEPKSYMWHNNLWKSLISKLDGSKPCDLSHQTTVDIPKNIAKVDKPSKLSLVSRHQSRFKSK